MKQNTTPITREMNINSLPEWLALIISSAGTSATINIAWSEWTKHRDKKLRRRNAYLEASSNIEDYVQLCINSIEFECDALNYYAYNSSITNHNGKEIYAFDKPETIEQPDFNKTVLNNINSDLIFIEDKSEIKETANNMEKINRALRKKVEEQEQKLKLHLDDPTCIFEEIFSLKITALTSCGINACNLAMKTRKKSRTKSKSLEEKSIILKSIVEKYNLTIYR